MHRFQLRSIVLCSLLAPSTRAGGVDPSDWSSIRKAYEAGRRAVVAVEGGYGARDPGNRWTIRFDGRGFDTRPDDGSWGWGLQLVRWGFAGREREVAGEACACAKGERLTYERDASLSEWYVNDRRGLEQGFTVRERPEGDGPLTFVLAVRGELRPQVQSDGRGVSFSDGAGAAVLTYAGLAAYDADGRSLPARLDLAAEGLRLSVDERGARYPIRIDPTVQQAYLKASNTGIDDAFGLSVAISGDTVVVGAPLEDSNATGVGGNQGNNSATDSGAAYIFVRTGTTWSQQAYLKASNTDPNDNFGVHVAISGDTVVVGAPFEASNATGVNGNQGDNSAPNSGAAYVFVRTGSTWSQQAYLKASNTDAGDQFGFRAAISGDTLVVGAYLECSGATGVNGNQSDNGALGAGAAYVFVRSGTTWSQQAYLKASNTDAQDDFGSSVAISGDTIVVGADQESSNATGVNGNQSDNSATNAGAAYVFARSGTTWSQQAYLKASNTNASDLFGCSLAVSGDTVLVGADLESSSATGVNGNQSDNSALGAGAAYVFVRGGTTWSQQAYLKASNTNAQDLFGISVGLSGETAVVGAIFEDSNATGVNGNQSNNSASDSGAAYVFLRTGTTWTQEAYLKASNTDSNDFFGSSVAISDETVVVGAYGEASNATGVNGNQSDNSASISGAAYVFLLPTPGIFSPFCFPGTDGVRACPCSNPPTSVGVGCNNFGPNPPGGTGGAQLSATGTASAGTATTLVFHVTGLQTPCNLVVLFCGTNPLSAGVASGAGVRCVSQTVVPRPYKTISGFNSGSVDFPSADVLPQGPGSDPWTRSGSPAPGTTRYYYANYRNPAAGNFPPCTPFTAFNLTNAGSVVWIP